MVTSPEVLLESWGSGSSSHFLAMEEKIKPCKFIVNGNAGIMLIFMADVLLGLLAGKMNCDYV